MSEKDRESPSPSTPATPGASPRWTWAAAGAVVLAFVIALWADHAASPPLEALRAAPGAPPTRAASPAGELPADHPPIDEGRAPEGTPSGMVGVSYDVHDAGQVWSRSCALCHGEDGRPTDNGRSLGTPDLTDPATQSVLTDERIAQVIRQGRLPVMPAYGEKLPDPTVQELVGKVRSLIRGS